MFERLAAWLEQNAMACYYHKYLGVQCPGCGMQRSMAELLRGNFSTSLELFPALVPLLFMFLFLMMHLVFKFRSGAAILKYAFIVNAFIIMVTWVIRMAHHFNN
jgi:Na+-driven multidrug efflux pump